MSDATHGHPKNPFGARKEILARTGVAAEPSRPNTARNDATAPDPEPDLEILDAGDDDGPIPPREWLLGNAFCRKFVSGVIAAGAGGKTSLRIAQALALASNKCITGEFIFLRCRVLIVCLEDDMVELRRRVRAARKYHQISCEDIKDHLFLTTPMGLKVARYDAKGARVVPGELDRAIRRTIDQKHIDLVMIDPIKKSHAVAENDNDAMDGVVTLMAKIAIDLNVAFDITSHERKSFAAEAGDANRARGAGSMKDGGRLMYTLTTMTPEEAEAFGVADEGRKFLFRVDSAKFNLGPPQNAAWFKLIGVRLENGSATYPNGDEVQTVERWTPPKMFDGLAPADLNKALQKLADGMGDGRR